MDTGALKKFAQAARNLLIGQVEGKLDVVLAENSQARREFPQAVRELEQEIDRTDRQQVVEKVAYTWFNRFTALRFMDVNNYTSIRAVSAAEGQTRPEILAEASAGHIDDSVPAETRDTISQLLDGRLRSHDAQGEAYRLLLVATCNQWHATMPFLFEKIADYTELLMPEDLLSQGSILAEMREVMTEEACQDVEIIGWLYQFYISEKKDAVFAGLKKNVKITAENIPAATQLFTPHWIVRYLVENSLGRLWMLNHPQSKLVEQMDYYIAPEELEEDFLRIGSPEEIKLCDPACGSGHMLTYAFDLLYAIYEEEGYDASEIPNLILTHNLTGIEIDERAGALAGFALTMKAAGKRRRFLRRPVLPNICVLENVRFTEAEMQDVAAVVGEDLFTDELCETLRQFEQAKNFGSLIVPKLRDPAETLRVVEARDFGGDLLLKELRARVVAVLRTAEALSSKYNIVVANPPYMSVKGMNGRLATWTKKTFPSAKADLMTCFMERAGSLSVSRGYWGMINLPSWMFLTSFQKLREGLIQDSQICSLLHLGRGIFGSDFGSVAFTVRNFKSNEGFRGCYRRLFEKHVLVRAPEVIRDLFLDKSYNSYWFQQKDFRKISGQPIAYWLSEKFLAMFEGPRLDECADVKMGMRTGDNERFLREWFEVSGSKFGKNFSNATSARASGMKWFPHQKGGDARRWYGIQEYVVNWEDDGREIKDLVRQNYPDLGDNLSWKITNEPYYFKKAAGWTALTAGLFCLRYYPEGFVFDTKGQRMFPKTVSMGQTLSLMNSKPIRECLQVLCPTLDFTAGPMGATPFLHVNGHDAERLERAADRAVEISKFDWDTYETSWDFTTLRLLQADHRADALETTYAALRTRWQGMTGEMQRLEEENNRTFIDAYELQDELTSEVPLKEITLTCNPAYRYGGKKTDAELEDLLRADTMKEFISYGVGCMFGRYSLDEPGLILSNQGDGMDEYFTKVPEPTFEPDADNVIPVLDGDWFADDITDRFRKFLRVTFGEEKFQENLRFIEEAIGKDLRKYFVKDFYADHVKRYKKRPIYWMFSSPKGSFNALIYMHRYRPDTASVVLNDYLREYRSKLEVHRAEQERLSDDPGASQSARTKALKEVDRVSKIIDELSDWERDVVYPLATRKIEIDLDDGVKANYPKFGAALKKIPGLS